MFVSSEMASWDAEMHRRAMEAEGELLARQMDYLRRQDDGEDGMGWSPLENLVASYLCDKDDPTRLTSRRVINHLLFSPAIYNSLCLIK
jgi:hypothetical protein